MLDYGYGDAQEREQAERADDHSERAQVLLNASAIRFCPQCDVEVLAKRNGECVWCDTETTMFFREDAAGAIPTRSRSNDSSSDSRASLKPSTQPPASSSGAGGRVAHNEEAA